MNLEYCDNWIFHNSLQASGEITSEQKILFHLHMGFCLQSKMILIKNLTNLSSSWSTASHSRSYYADLMQFKYWTRFCVYIFMVSLLVYKVCWWLMLIGPPSLLLQLLTLAKNQLCTEEKDIFLSSHNTRCNNNYYLKEPILVNYR